MPSLRHQLLTRMIPLLRGRSEVHDPEAVRRDVLARQAQADDRPPGRVVRRLDVRRDELDGLRYFRVTAPVDPRATPADTPVDTLVNTSERPTVVYLHGGGYVAGLDRFHWRYVARLARSLGWRVVLPDYPLTPTHTWRDSLGPICDLVRQLGQESPGGLVLMGDSAGGGLAVAVAQEVVRRASTPLRGLVLFAPFVDAAGATPGTEEARAGDPWLTLTKLRLYGGWWSDGDPTDPRASPLRGDLAGLPPMLVMCGTRDLLLPQVRELVSRARAAGTDVTYVEEPELLHVYPLLPVPEARRAWAQVRSFLA